jgi:starvation-inducible outer membrane lipoprotein
MKKIFYYILPVILILSICGCSTQTSSDESKLIKKDDFGKVFESPKIFKGCSVDTYAEILQTPDITSKNITIEAAVFPFKTKDTVFIKVTSSNFDNRISKGKYIHLKGVLNGTTDKKIKGIKKSYPLVKADKIEMSDYITAMGDSLSEPYFKSTNLPIKQTIGSITMQLYSIGFFKNQTSIEYSIKNSSNETFKLGDAVLKQNNKSYPIQQPDNSQLSSLPADINVGPLEVPPESEKHGLLFFKRLDSSMDGVSIIFTPEKPNSDSFKLYMDINF